MSGEEIAKSLKDKLTPFLLGSVLIGGGGNVLTASMAPDVIQMQENSKKIEILEKSLIKAEDRLQVELGQTQIVLREINTRLSRIEGKMGIGE